jgi:NitT/TauT family transport system substrate-binding protein
VAEAHLQAEGFAEVQYVELAGIHEAFLPGKANISMIFVAPLLLMIEAGEPIVILAGGHVGCFELVASAKIRAIRDLKGKRVAVVRFGSAAHVFLSSMLAYVGLDPRKDVSWVIEPLAESTRLMTEGKVDAFMAFPPAAQELRAKQIGQVVVNSTLDRPWSQYFCCVLAGHRDFVSRNPVATKRALRAIIKSSELCAIEPERVARTVVDRGLTPRLDYAVQTIRELPYGKWRDYHPEDTVRFYALRLHEAGMIKSSPQKLIAQATDWRFLNELKKELKG